MPSTSQTQFSAELPQKSSEDNMPTTHDEYIPEPTKGTDPEEGSVMNAARGLTIFERKAALINV